MTQNVLPPRILFCLLLVIALTSCAPVPAATEAPAAPEAPAASEAPATEAPAEAPVMTEAPAASEPPAPSEVPAMTVVPMITGAPAPTKQPPSTVAPVPTEVPPSTPLPVINEARRLTLEYPPRMRAGDSDIVRLTLEMDDLGNISPTAQIGGNVVAGEVIEIPNLYETHHVIAEARFDIAGMLVAPPELFSQTLSAGQSVTFFWSIHAQEAGVYRGTVWLYLKFVDKLTGEESRKTVSAQIVEIEAANFLGFTGSLARFLGLAGSLIGTVVGFPFFEDIVKFLYRRRIRRG